MILYVTTFNKLLYDFSGRKMLQSFLAKKVEGDIFIGYEGDINFEEDFPNNKFILYNLNQDELLTKFLQDNSVFIPPEFGGTAPPCACKEPNKKERLKGDKERRKSIYNQKERKKYKGHLKGCVEYGYNKRASRWARKIFCLKQANDSLGDKYETLFFIDCDVIWKQQLTEEDIKRMLKDNEIGYLLGRRRKIWETGCVIYHNKGRELIDLILNEYISGRYRDLDRWDDSSVTTYIGQKSKLSKIDLASHSTHVSDVWQDSVLEIFCSHQKGSHSQLQGCTPKRIRGETFKQKVRPIKTKKLKTPKEIRRDKNKKKKKDQLK